MPPTFEDAFAAHQAGDFETAERGYRACPSTNAAHNLGSLLKQTGRLAEAEAVFREILCQRPLYEPAQHSLAMTLLALRRYAEAWPLYEARRAVHGFQTPRAAYPEWRGESLAGKRLVVVSEQGLGDQIMFARWVPVLQALGAQVTLACDPRTTARLFERCGFATFAYWRPSQALPPADYWTPIASLPFRLGGVEPAPAVYIPSKRGGSGVGVMARGNPANSIDRWRSLAGVDAEALLALGQDLAPTVTGARDLLETAEIIDDLELVITVDTSVAHLAAAMGKPCWVLLARIAVDWRWNDGERSDWYPAARLFRQEAPGEWAGVLDRVRQALA